MKKILICIMMLTWLMNNGSVVNCSNGIPPGTDAVETMNFDVNNSYTR